MLNILIFAAGAAIMFWMGLRSLLARRRLCTKGEKVSARVTGTVQSSSGSAYVLEFETQGAATGSSTRSPAGARALKWGRPLRCFMTPMTWTRCM